MEILWKEAAASDIMGKDESVKGCPLRKEHK